MRTIPSSVASMLLSDLPDLRATLRPFGRQVGDRVEVDLDALGAAYPSLCRALEAYQSATERLWSGVEAGTAGGAAYTVSRRRAVDHQQVTGKVGRRDLREVLDALHSVPAAAAAVGAATELSFDASQVAARVEDVGGDVSEPEPGVLVLTIPLEGGGAWPAELGGPAGWAEVARSVRVTVRHARWRDRAVRTLSRVEVLVDELWPDPRAARALLDAA